jgi:magnesium chelatase subunit I
LDLSDAMSHADYVKALKNVRGLESLARKMMKPADDDDLALAMEFIVDGLHQNFLLTKRFLGRRVSYSDALSSMMAD